MSTQLRTAAGQDARSAETAGVGGASGCAGCGGAATALQDATQSLPSSGLRWDGATAEQLAFMRQVYDAQVRRASRARSFVADVPASELGAIEGGARARTAAAAACQRLLADARAALAAARAAGDQLALGAERISVASAYRSASQQFQSWQGSFPRYYEQTRARRVAAQGGEHGAQAVALTMAHIGSLLAAPGYSLHNNGLAIDFGTRQSGRDLGPSASQRVPWRASWLWHWMEGHANGYGFYQNTSIDEPWHWEFRGAPAAASHGVAEAAMSHGVAEALDVAASQVSLPRVPLLARHHDAGPDVVLRWNRMADVPTGVDVVVHLHGFSSDRHLDLTVRKLPLSGLDFTPPSPPLGSGAAAHQSWSGRTRPTLLVLPRGQARPGHAAAYDFPALVEGDGFAELVRMALHELSSRVGVGRPIEARRIILTAHSGGGAPMNRILARTAGTPFDPHEVHVFDALYGEPSGLRGWLNRRLGADLARLREGVWDPAAYLRDEAGALRIFYTVHGQRETERHSLELQQQINRMLPQGTPMRDQLLRRYRVELSRVGHSLVPYWYGGRLLADPSDGAAPSGQLASEQLAAVAAPTPEQRQSSDLGLNPIEHRVLAARPPVPGRGEFRPVTVPLLEIPVSASALRIVREGEFARVVATVGAGGLDRRRRHEQIPATAVAPREVARVAEALIAADPHQRRSVEPQGHLPSATPTTFVPRPAGPIRRLTPRPGRDRDPGASVFAPEQRRVFSDRAFPWRTVGKINTAGATASGVTIGPRLVLTASHVVNWTGGTGGSAGWLTFSPGYFDGPGPWGEIPASRVLYWEQAPSALTDTETAFDYVVLVMAERIGDIVGYPGVRTYESRWNGQTYWQALGYPGDMASGERPSFQGDCVVSSVAQHNLSGQTGYVMGHFNDMAPGESGGPVWGWWPDELWPRVVGVHSTESATPARTTSGDNEYGGGPALGALVAWARTNFP